MLLLNVGENEDEKFERKVKRRVVEAIERRIAECVKDEAFQQELKREVEKARMEARTNMHKEVEAEKVLIQKSFDEKLKAPKKTGDEHTSTKELPPTVAVVKESEAEALRKEKKLESLRKIAEEREKRMRTGGSPTHTGLVATTGRAEVGPSISFSLKKLGR